MKLGRLIKICLNETCSEVLIGRTFPDASPIQNGLKQGAVLLPLLFSFALEYAIRKLQGKQERTGIEWNTLVPGLCH
jgi:hypothetical protein